MPSDLQKNWREAATKVALIVIFLLLFAGFIWATNRFDVGNQARIQFVDLILLGFATLRLGRLISYDLVMQPLRSPFTETVTDPSGAGDNVQAKGSGFRRAIGEMLSCPICTGTWAAAFLVYGLYLFPAPTRAFLIMTAVIGLAEVFNALLEVLNWLGKFARASTGSKERFAVSPTKPDNNPQRPPEARE